MRLTLLCCDFAPAGLGRALLWVRETANLRKTHKPRDKPRCHKLETWHKDDITS